MYAFVANGIQTICYTQRQLDALLAIYPYPKFTVVRSEEEGRSWLRRHTRGITEVSHEKYGDTAKSGYASVSYEILDDSVDYKIDTSKIGYLRIQSTPGVSVDSRVDKLHIVVDNLKLRDDIIQHHVIAIRRVLKLLGEFIDVDIRVPDISIYLALMKYNGKDYTLRSTQRELASRMGAVSVTVENKDCQVSEDLSNEVEFDFGEYSE